MTTEHRQVVVTSREEALARFTQANFLDCRISAYPMPSELSSFVGINLEIAPGVVMIDLDRETFQSQKAFEMALTKTLKKIRETIISEPTVIWSGSGYHIYLVLDAFVLEGEDVFNNNRFGSNSSQRFLRFAEWFLSNGKCDPQHNKTLSLRNCMLRVPGSINSKNGQTVGIVKRWNGSRPSIKLLLEDFYVYLCGQRISQLEEKRSRNYSIGDYRCKDTCNNIRWIERLLHTPIQDYRKFAIWRVLVPYLVNVKRLSEEEASSVIETWLNECSKLNRLRFYPKSKIRESLNGAAKGYRPISRDKLKIDNEEFYKILQDNGVLS